MVNAARSSGQNLHGSYVLEVTNRPTTQVHDGRGPVCSPEVRADPAVPLSVDVESTLVRVAVLAVAEYLYRGGCAAAIFSESATVRAGRANYIGRQR